MRARGYFRHDTAKPGMVLVLSQDTLGDDRPIPIEQRTRRFIARALDPEDWLDGYW
jgi:hypothetical protein